MSSRKKSNFSKLFVPSLKWRSCCEATQIKTGSADEFFNSTLYSYLDAFKYRDTNIFCTDNIIVDNATWNILLGINA